ncbi:MAG: DoxX family membrane protein [Bacteroidetes bacterium]|nr:DoxX family membrane protein [Bacteroidota bacterium]
MENLDSISLLLRLVTGTLFFFQGYDKIFKVKIDNVARTFDDPMNPPIWPKPLLKPMITLSSFAEMFGGIFLFFGLFKFVTLSILSFDLLFVVFTFSSIKAMGHAILLPALFIHLIYLGNSFFRGYL